MTEHPTTTSENTMRPSLRRIAKISSMVLMGSITEDELSQIIGSELIDYSERRHLRRMIGLATLSLTPKGGAWQMAVWTLLDQYNTPLDIVRLCREILRHPLNPGRCDQ